MNSTQAPPRLSNRKSYALPLFVALMYLFLYIPIFIMILFSFNKSPIIYKWTGFSLKWYYELFEDPSAWDSFYNSLSVAFSASFLSVLMGLPLVYFGKKLLEKSLLLFYGALIIPEIVIAVGLLTIFSYFNVPLGLPTIIAGHTVLGLGYAIPILYIRLKELQTGLTEASLDLGATRTQTFFKIILPLLTPAIIASFLLAFIVSMDDFIIAFFCSSPSTETLPLYIFAAIRGGASQVISALSVIFLLIGSILVLLLSSSKIRSFFLSSR